MRACGRALRRSLRRAEELLVAHLHGQLRVTYLAEESLEHVDSSLGELSLQLEVCNRRCLFDDEAQSELRQLINRS